MLSVLVVAITRTCQRDPAAPGAKQHLLSLHCGNLQIKPPPTGSSEIRRAANALGPSDQRDRLAPGHMTGLKE